MLHSESTLARRDWLKATSLGALATLVGSGHSMANKPSSPHVKGIVFLVSDGMSPGVFSLAEAFSQNTRGKGTAWHNLWNRPEAARGLMDTASADSLVTDSAAAATSWGGGQRVNNGAINYTPSGKAIEPISQALKKAGVKLGLVTTTRLTHATPAGFASAVTNRGMENPIAEQFIDQADILLGGGSKFFDAASRSDKKDVFGEFQKAGYTILRNRQELLASRETKILGTFTSDHLPYALDHFHDEKLRATVPTLSEMTEAALDRFLPGDSPFLLVVEGGRIDHAAHMNCIAGVLNDQIAFDDAVAAALAKTADRKDILVVVTSDHGNANPALNGIGARYHRSNEAFAKVSNIHISFERLCQTWNRKKDADTAALKSFIETHLHFTPGKNELEALFNAFENQQAEDWNHQHQNQEGLLGQILGNHVGVGWTGISHTSDPTLVSAIGPGAEKFSGLVVNTDVYRHLRELLAV